ncbi:hypothetical protein C2S53_010687 [Perilla frutescens var. hirtella]|uniref:Uncharacterized protein n=1 Tax=Perilla frutescens var. hirtella TaxID=608512 RepID=A0AAD4IVY9_PERFH|nr:hypothetical protein C2S53_010687 [Perilla frutescens var. hirtella]
MDSDKLESLKSLNRRLLHEAVERRQQVDSLLQSKGSLELELARSNSEREGLESELARLVERAAELEVERRVVAVFVAVQVGVKGEEFDRKIKGLEIEMREWKREVEEKRSEIMKLNGTLSEIKGTLKDEREVSKRVRVERDDFEDKLNRQIKEDEGLRANLIELGGQMREVEREFEELRTSYNDVVREKGDMEMRIKLLKGERDLLERGLMESNKLIGKMKEEISVIVREKEGVEKEKNAEMIKRRELENDVSGLNEMVVNLQKKELKLQTVVAELEEKCVVGEEKLKEMGREIDQLVNETKFREKKILGLIDEKSVIEKDLGEALEQLAEQKREIGDLANEKIVMLEAKNRANGEVEELRNHVDELKAAVLELEGLNQANLKMIRSLESEVGDYRCMLEKANVERDGVERCLNEEKQNGLRLKESIQELEKIIEESNKVAGEVKAENAAILTEKVELEGRCDMQRKEIASLQDSIVKAQDEFGSLKSKVELADANSEQMLNLLKGTSAFCSKDECDGEVGSLLVDDEELKLHVVEMETIKKAFMSKVAKVEDMKRQLECLQSSVVDEQKKRSFWAALSSATTLLAAISLAYLARGH